MEKPRILIADDDDIIRDLLNELFKSTYDLTFVTRGIAAYRTLGKDPSGFSLILSDNEMGDELTGAKFLRLIRSQKWDVPFVLMSGRPWPPDELESLPETCAKNNATFVQKPFSLEIRGIVTKLLSSHEAKPLSRPG